MIEVYYWKNIKYHKEEPKTIDEILANFDEVMRLPSGNQFTETDMQKLFSDLNNHDYNPLLTLSCQESEINHTSMSVGDLFWHSKDNGELHIYRVESVGFKNIIQ
jgi:hypothetical protein